MTLPDPFTSHAGTALTNAGTVLLTVDFGSADSALQNLCGSFTNGQGQQGSIAVTGSGPASATFTLDTNASDCENASEATRTGLHQLGQLMNGSGLSKKGDGPGLPRPLPAGVSFAGLVLIGYLGRRSRKLRNITAVLTLLLAVFSLSACGGTASLLAANPPPGNYSGTITGHDSAKPSITSTTNFTLTIQ